VMAAKATHVSRKTIRGREHVMSMTIDYEKNE